MNSMNLPLCSSFLRDDNDNTMVSFVYIWHTMNLKKLLNTQAVMTHISIAALILRFRCGHTPAQLLVFSLNSHFLLTQIPSYFIIILGCRFSDYIQSCRDWLESWKTKDSNPSKRPSIAGGRGQHHGQRETHSYCQDQSYTAGSFQSRSAWQQKSHQWVSSLWKKMGKLENPMSSAPKPLPLPLMPCIYGVIKT